MCKSESSQRYESRAQSVVPSKAQQTCRVFNCLCSQILLMFATARVYKILHIYIYAVTDFKPKFCYHSEERFLSTMHRLFRQFPLKHHLFRLNLNETELDVKSFQMPFSKRPTSFITNSQEKSVRSKCKLIYETSSI